MIYFVRAGNDGPVKIGFAVNVAARLRTLQAGNPARFVLLREMPGGLGAEAWHHRRFAKWRIDREWFHYRPEMLSVTHPVDANDVGPGVPKLREFLSQAGKTPQQFANEMGVTTSAVAMWMRGARMPRREMLQKIKQATEGRVTADDFADAA